MEDMPPPQLILQTHLNLNQYHCHSHCYSQPLSESTHCIYFTLLNHNYHHHHYTPPPPPPWFNRFSSTPTSLNQLNQLNNNNNPNNSNPNHHNSDLILSTRNGQLIILRSTQPHQTNHHHQPDNQNNHQSNNNQNHIKASPTVSVSVLIPQNLIQLDHPPALQQTHHPPSPSHSPSPSSRSLSRTRSNRQHSPKNQQTKTHPSSPAASSNYSSCTQHTHTHPTPRSSISHPFESLWQGSNQQNNRSPLSFNTLDPLKPPTPSDPPNPTNPTTTTHQLTLPPSTPPSHYSFCASTLITPSGYADPIVSIKIFNQTPPSSSAQPHHPATLDAPQHPPHHHLPNQQESLIFTLTRFGKCSKVSPIDGHVIDSIDLSNTDGLVPFDDWSFLQDDPQSMMPQTQGNTLILCISSSLQPILLDVLDLSILPVICSGPPVKASHSFFKTKVWKQSKISNNQWSINLISLTWSKELYSRELKLSRDDETTPWNIVEPTDSILLKDFGDQIDLEEQVEFVIDQDCLAVWSASRFWIFESASSTSGVRNLDPRTHSSKREALNNSLDRHDLIVSLSFIHSFGVVLVSKKSVKLFRCIGLQPSPTGCSEWKLAPIDEARFTLEGPFHFEFAINKSTVPSSIDNQVAFINSINLITVDLDPVTGQRRLSELSFTTDPSTHPETTQIPDPDPDATVTLSNSHLQVYHCRRDLYLSSPIIQPNQPKPTCLTCSIWLPDDHHPAVLIGDSMGLISIYSLNIPSRNSSTTQVSWKLERLEKQENLGGPISALYADQQWVISGGLLGDIAVWSRKTKPSIATIRTSDQSSEDPYAMQMLNRMVLGAVPIESVGRLPNQENHRAGDGQEPNDSVCRFACTLMDGSVIVFNLSETGLIDIDGELPPLEPTVGISELWSNGPEIMVIYRERRLCAQRWLCSKNLLANLGRREAQNMIEFENSQLGLKWVQTELSNCQAQSGGSQLDTSRVFNVYGLPAFNILSVRLRDFVESIGLQEGPALAGRLSMVRLMISQLFPWGLDPALDASVERGLRIGRPSIQERLENLNVISGDHDERSGLTLYRNNGDQRVSSEYEKTYRIMNLVVLLRVFLNEARYERHASETISGLVRLASSSTNNLSDTAAGVWLDLKILVKYWLDPSAEVREASRLLLGIRLGSMAQSEIEELVSSWEGFLPIQQDFPAVKTENDWTFGRKTGSVVQKTLHKSEEMDPRQRRYTSEEMQINAMLLIGLIVSERYQLLSTKVLKNLSIAVFQAISPSPKLTHQPRIQTLKAGLEICSRTFEIIQNYIDAIELVRNLFGWATGRDGEISGELKGTAKYACLHVASVNTPLFMTTLSYDLMISHNPSDRISTMKLVVFMRPLVLHASLPRLLEAVVKSLDPTQKQMRAQTQTGATVILHELVKTYPSIAFHGPSQKLAIGTPEGAIIIYDLRTSTKTHVLESFRTPVAACSFSHDGQRLVSVSLDENRIEIWRFGTAPFALAAFFKLPSTSSSRQDLLQNQSPSSSATAHTSSQPFKSLSFNVGEEALMSVAGTLEWIRIDWLGHRSCRLRIRQSSITFSC